MDQIITSSNSSFNFLKGNSDFLNLVLDNICNCVLLFDKNMQLQAFNDAMKTLFVNDEDEHLLYKKCGNAIGCAFAVEEEKDCGDTTHCNYCDLREAAMISYSEQKPVYRERFEREFFRTDGNRVMKYLNFSTRLFYFKKEYYILIIIEDITELIKLRAAEKNT